MADQELFDLKQHYIYAVFADKVQIGFGQTVLRDHYIDSDAQEIYQKFLDHTLKSTKSTIKSSDLLAYLTTAKFVNDKWRGTCEGFPLHWII